MLTFTQAVDILKDKASKKIGNNTRLVRNPADENGNSSVFVVFHDTPVVTIDSDDVYTLDSGRYRTVTTKARLNEYTPFHVYQKSGEWWISDNRDVQYEKSGDWKFYDGIRLYGDGEVVFD